jgi:hypothetical protein
MQYMSLTIHADGQYPRNSEVILLVTGRHATHQIFPLHTLQKAAAPCHDLPRYHFMTFIAASVFPDM